MNDPSSKKASWSLAGEMAGITEGDTSEWDSLKARTKLSTFRWG